MSSFGYDPKLSRRRLVRAGGAAAALGFAGCLGNDGDSDGDDGDAEPDGPELEVLHPWIAPAEHSAMETLTAAFEDANPDIVTDFFANSGDTPYRERIGDRLDADAPPSSFACRAGGNLERYRAHLGAAADEIWKEADLSSVSPPEIRNLCRVDGEQLAVPVGAYRTNHLFYSVRVVEEAGVDPDALSTPAELMGALDRVAETTDATPMAHPMKGSWATLQLFANVLLGQDGNDAYVTFVEDGGAGSAVRSALETTGEILSNYVTDDAASMNPAIANDSLASDEAAFLPQGTWTATDLRANDFDYGADWGSVPFPGTDGTYGLALDSFVAPVDGAGENPSPRATDAWLRHVADAESQRSFNARRGSVPPRTDISTAPFDQFLTELTEEFRTADSRPPSLAHGLAVAPEQLSAMESVVEEQFSGPFDVDATAEGLLEVTRNG
ncbi:ABC transporter substrate-binding protein [Natronoarchaeum mannanilyticum]|uniref:Extracellular solute-binding protein n=1 Tax=Natronoarchaeum mannanilyticum TaxID=926360 RepID=A0AAV3TCV5_9EURY